MTVEGARQGWSAYDRRDLVPFPGRDYGALSARRSRYNLARHYANNTMYDVLNGVFATQLVNDQRLYKFIRGLYNPIQRATDLMKAYTYPGVVNDEDLTAGAFPLQFKNSRLELPIKNILKWSNLSQQLDPYVNDTVLLGDNFWWIVDDTDSGRVRMELLDPGSVKYREVDQVDNVKSCVIEYEISEEPDLDRYEPSKDGIKLRDTKTHTYSMVATQDEFREYIDGKLDRRWDNPYGFVPLKPVRYAHAQDGWGRNILYGVQQRLIDEINDTSSLTNDSIRNIVVPLLQAIGINSADDIKVPADKRDDLRMVFLSKTDAKLEAVNIPLAIDSATKNREEMVIELERDLPVLKLQRLSESGDMSGKAIKLLFGDSISQVKGLRKNTDHSAASSLQMAITIYGMRGYDGGEWIDSGSYDRGELKLSVADRPVVSDTPDAMEKLTVLPQVKDQPPAIARQMLVEMDYPTSVINDIMDNLQVERDRAEMTALLAGLSDNTNGNNNPTNRAADDNSASARDRLDAATA